MANQLFTCQIINPIFIHLTRSAGIRYQQLITIFQLTPLSNLIQRRQ